MNEVSVQKVSAVLRKAGLNQSGGNTYVPTPGFQVSKWWNPPNTVRVDHMAFHMPNKRSLDAILASYQTALEAKGIVVERDGDFLICTGINEV